VSKGKGIKKPRGKKIPKKNEKPIDKIKKICYNNYTR
jgi:hypothetical protein